MTNVIGRFLKYVKVDTQSDPDAAEGKCPSTNKQLNLAWLLEKELLDMGAHDVTITPEGYVYATVPAGGGCGAGGCALGLIAHLDTSNAVSGENVSPVLTRNYNGSDIALGGGVTLSPAEYPDLLKHIGKTIICANGDTLLGADDKAGIAEIMTLAEMLLADPSLPRPTLRIAFTPDEEIGRGADKFDLELFKADFAYTVDGGELGEIEYENFNAAQAEILIRGTSIHPGTAKSKMLNAILVAHELQSMLPAFQNPATTEKYEGFFHLDTIKGSVDAVRCIYIIRDHDIKKFEQKKRLMESACKYLNEKFGEGTVTCNLKDQYFNMAEMIKPHIHLVENAKKAMTATDVQPIVKPIRGGTDGARLSFMGLPCPNLGTGGYNAHGRHEFVPAEDMEKIVQILLHLVSLYA